jgi:hypothetical protein
LRQFGEDFPARDPLCEQIFTENLQLGGPLLAFLPGEGLLDSFFLHIGSSFGSFCYLNLFFADNSDRVEVFDRFGGGFGARFASFDAFDDVSGVITDYSVSTSGIADRQASSNNLNVTVSITFKNRLDEKKNFESSITRNFPFSSGLSLQQAEAQLNEQIINNLTDEIFNKIFSNW